MQYLSTNDTKSIYSLLQVMTHSAPDDGGLFWPRKLPEIPRAFFNNFASMSFSEMAYVLANQLFGDDVPAARLKKIVDSSFNFEVLVRHVGDNIYCLELFHGPTLAFKDFGARFMARMVNDLRTNGPEKASIGKLNVIVATTGNTGSAIANGFSGIEGVEVFILFPRGTAGRQLEAQFTTLGGNIHALEVQGTIDDCHALAMQAYSDKELNSRIALTSANSTNIVRLLPQMFYYFYALAKMREMLPHTPVTLVVPAGNLGNLTAALGARAMGLKIDNIIAAENSNDYLTRRLREPSREPLPRRAVPTLAYAADKSMPSNWQRLSHICGGVQGMTKQFTSMSFSDADIIQAVNTALYKYDYVVDPHTALAFAAATTRVPKGHAALIVGAAHPAKSLTAMSAITGRAMELPLQLTRFMTGKDLRQRIAPTYDALRTVIMNQNK